jgi:glutamyl/glutaminyl-tRNA synthetase
VRWLGFDWGEHLYFASDYFEQMYAFAEHLIRKGLAYVDSSSEEEIREARGTVTEPGRPTRYRDRSRRRAWTCSGACARASSRMARTCCAAGSTWRRPTC